MIDPANFLKLKESVFSLKLKLEKASDYEFIALFTDFLAHCEAYVLYAALDKCPLSQRQIFEDLDELKSFKDDFLIQLTSFPCIEFFDSQVAILVSEKEFLDPAFVTYQNTGGKGYFLTKDNPKIPFCCYFSKEEGQSQVEIENKTTDRILQIFSNISDPGTTQDDPRYSEIDLVKPGEKKTFEPNIWVAEMKIIGDLGVIQTI